MSHVLSFYSICWFTHMDMFTLFLLHIGVVLWYVLLLALDHLFHFIARVSFLSIFFLFFLVFFVSSITC